ncbi:hypothetical protein L228DRAFT_259393 [Xylona heveae TC161]|uniref:Ubiquitin-like domain-containing protein n=1 Tax=Xylona heveae (strain CBS 132557 / TC161) TaxID=1328760 RepID=A0A165HZE6_XYLHT|nr:hypothetical protein L228DRAFT_259393 [Xylona heveae TC161]KZF24134.1 hypothetical protein L228DRAFT_259393 [Xylona heveae TC161]
MASSPGPNSYPGPVPPDDNPESESFSSSTPPTMFLHVLSPSTLEVPSQLSFPSLPISTTVGQLKEKIRDAIPSKPVAERQRLIYQGRLLARDTDTMLDVFGQQAINDPISHKLHLVLRPDRSEDGPSSSPSPARAVSPIPPALGAQDRPSVAPGAPLPQVPAATGSTIHQPNHRAYNNVPLPHGPILTHFQANLPPNLQNILNQQLATLNQQHPQPQITISGPTGQPPQVQPRGYPSYQHPGQSAQPTFQQRVSDQQQARASAGLHGISQSNSNGTGGAPPLAGSTASHQQPQQHAPFEAQPQPGTLPPGPATHLNAQGQGPNGFAFVVNESTTVIPHMAGNNPLLGLDGRSASPRIPLPGLGNTPIAVPAIGQGLGGHHPFPQYQRPAEQHAPLGHAHTQANHPQVQHLFEALLSLSRRITNLENLVARNQLPLDREINDARQHPGAASHQQLQQTLTNLNQRINDLSTRADMIRNMLSRLPDPSQTSSRPPSSQPMQQSQSAPSANVPTAPDPATVYLLSSPDAPHALVLPPSGGIYASPIPGNGQPVHHQVPLAQPFARGPAVVPVPDPAQLHQQILNNANELINRTRGNGAIQQRIQAQQLQQQHAQVDNVVGQAQAQAQARAQAQNRGGGRELMRIILPIGGHLWLLIRLIGVILFLTSSGGWMRVIMLFLATMLVFSIQIGVFNHIRQALWDPIRRHIEGLVPFGAENADEDFDAEGEEEEEEEEEGQGRPRREPDPREAAARLLRARQQHDRGRIMGQIRRVERALVLFLGSLIPGVGERQVAAREEAVAAVRRAEERERERQERDERERREREQQEHDREQQEQDSTQAGATNDGPESNNVEAGNATISSASEPGVVASSPGPSAAPVGESST